MFLMPALVLAVLFGMIAVLSTIIGLGGGTFYLMSMDLFSLPISIIPVIALLSNISVSGIGIVSRVLHKEKCTVKLLAIILLPSMTSSYLGASIQVQDQLFRLVLNFSLIAIIIIRIFLERKIDGVSSAHIHSDTRNISGTREISDTREISGTRKIFGTYTQKKDERLHTFKKSHYVRLFFISLAIGFISGLIGIGGGIILGPILYIYGLSYKDIPLITAMYIFVNSIVGMSAQIRKLDTIDVLYPYLFLVVVAVLGSMMSSKFIVFKIKSNQVKYIVMMTLGSIAIYNLIRLGVHYVR